MARMDSRRRFGQVNKMRSGRWQARFAVPLGHPSGRGGQVVTAPHTFEANTPTAERQLETGSGPRSCG
jgi:hypothetical protein